MRALAGWTVVIVLAAVPAGIAAGDPGGPEPVVLTFPVTPDAVGSIGAQDVQVQLASPVTADNVGSIGAQGILS